MIRFVTFVMAIFRQIKARPRLATSIMLACLVYLFLFPGHWRNVTKFLVAWDAGITLYLILAGVMMYRSDTTKIHARAAQQDDGSLVILVLTVFSAIASIIAIVTELVAVKGADGVYMKHTVLTGCTVVLTWLFMQTMFALHYAHEFYNRWSKNNDGGLEFPGLHPSPDYWDFVYFSFIIGTAAQTADINITSKHIRRIVAIHCVIVFFFNTTILALLVNISASLL